MASHPWSAATEETTTKRATKSQRSEDYFRSPQRRQRQPRFLRTWTVWRSIPVENREDETGTKGGSTATYSCRRHWTIVLQQIPRRDSGNSSRNAKLPTPRAQRWPKPRQSNVQHGWTASELYHASTLVEEFGRIMPTNRFGSLLEFCFLTIFLWKISALLPRFFYILE